MFLFEHNHRGNYPRLNYDIKHNNVGLIDLTYKVCLKLNRILTLESKNILKYHDLGSFRVQI